MIDYYASIKLVHMSCAWLSLAGFFLRGCASLARAQWLRHRLARILPISVDSLLLVSALTMASLSEQWPYQQAWLGAKFTALIVYILLGMVALHWGRNTVERSMGFAAALLTFAYMLAVATTRSAIPWS